MTRFGRGADRDPRWDLGGALFVFALFALVRALVMTRGLNVYDEGLVLTGAMRAAHGDLPHRDFYANYGPGQFYVLATLFKLFGPSVLIARAWDTFVRAATASAVYMLVRRLGSRGEAGTAAGLVAIWLVALRAENSPTTPVLLCAFAGAACLMPVFEGRPARRGLFAAGLSAGTATLFRYDGGVFVTAAEGTAVLAYGLMRPAPMWGRLRAVALDLASLAAGLVVVCAPVAAAYVASGVVADFQLDVLVYGSTLYRRMRSLAFPTLVGLWGNPIDLAIYMPALVWLLAGAIILQARRTRLSPRTWLLVLMTLMSALFYLKGYVRVSVGQMALSIMPALVVAISIYPVVRSTANRGLQIAAVVVSLFVVLPTIEAFAVGVANIAGTLTWMTARSTWAPASAATPAHLAPCHPQAHLGRMACFAVSDDRAAAIRYVASHTVPEERIFVGNGRHDVTFANDNLFYFLAGRQPATKWSHYDPGLQSNSTIQHKMIDELRRAKPRFVVLVDDFDTPPAEPNESGHSSGVTLLDAFLRATYAPVRSFGSTHILAPKA